jgi:hypothetical protein
LCCWGGCLCVVGGAAFVLLLGLLLGRFDVFMDEQNRTLGGKRRERESAAARQAATRREEGRDWRRRHARKGGRGPAHPWAGPHQLGCARLGHAAGLLPGWYRTCLPQLQHDAAAHDEAVLGLPTMWHAAACGMQQHAPITWRWWFLLWLCIDSFSSSLHAMRGVQRAATAGSFSLFSGSLLVSGAGRADVVMACQHVVRPCRALACRARRPPAGDVYVAS